MTRRLLVLLCLAATPVGAASPPEEATALKRRIERESKSLEALKQEIDKTRQEIDRLQTRAGQATESIALAQRRLNLTQNYVQRIKHDLETTEARIDSVERDIERLSLEIDVGTGRLHRRIRQIYKLGRAGTLHLLTSSRSLNDAYIRYKYLSLIAIADRRLVEEIQSDRRALLAARDNLALLQESNRKLLSEKEAETGRLEQERQRHRRLLTLVNTRREEHMAALKEKQETLQMLDSLIAELERKRQAALEEARRKQRAAPRPAREFESLKGNLRWPVAGRIASSFGIKRHPTFGTITVNRGIDIAAPMGARVHAVDRGTVVLARWFMSYGLTVILDHGGGYRTIYTHLGESFVSYGAQVLAGDDIGTVGDTGSLEGPVLHFEILQQLDPVDPVDWLGAR